MVWPQPFIPPQVACDVVCLRPLASPSCLRDSAAWAGFEGGALGKWLKWVGGAHTYLEAPWEGELSVACTEVSVGKASPALAQDGEETASTSISLPGEARPLGRSQCVICRWAVCLLIPPFDR